MLVQIIVILALLSQLLTWQAALAGLGVTLVLVPLSLWVSRWQARMRTHAVKRSDARVKLTSEVLSGKALTHAECFCIASLGQLHRNMKCSLH